MSQGRLSSKTPAQRLATEVQGCLVCNEHAVREAIGNTNYRILLDLAKEVLTAFQPRSSASNERSAFEQYILKERGEAYLTRRDEEYAGDFVQEAWEAWQARVAVETPTRPPREPTPEWLVRARAQGRAEAFELLQGLDAATFTDTYIGEHAIADTGDYDAHWNLVELRQALRVDDDTYSLIEASDAAYWEQQAELLDLKARRAEETDPPSAPDLKYDPSAKPHAYPVPRHISDRVVRADSKAVPTPPVSIETYPGEIRDLLQNAETSNRTGFSLPESWGPRVRVLLDHWPITTRTADAPQQPAAECEFSPRSPHM